MAVVLIAIWLIPHAVTNADGDTDFPWYLVPAAKGELADCYRGFMYPLMLKVFNFIWSDWMQAGRMISSLAMVGSLWFIFQVAGWPGAILLLVSPLFWFAGYSLTTDALAWVFMCGSYWAWWTKFWGSRWYWIDARESKLFEKFWCLKYLPISGLLAGFAACTRYPMLILLSLGLFVPWRKMWLFFTPTLTLIGIQIFLNLRNGFGVLGNNWQMNVLEKGAGLDIDILKNVVMFPMNFAMDAWPLFPIILLLAFIELIRQKRWELVIIGFGLIIGISLTFYSARFFLSVMLPVAIGGNLFLRRYTNE